MKASMAALQACATLLSFVAAPAVAESSAPPLSAGLAMAGCAAHTVPWPTADPTKYACQPETHAAGEAYLFLLNNMFPFDRGENQHSLVDGIFNYTVNKSLTARQEFPWAAAVPRALWETAVLPYASTNEARSNWRDLLWGTLAPLMKAAPPPTSALNATADAATYLNLNMWSSTALGKFNGKGNKITFHGEMTPRVYDPMSTILFGYASCTGVSILYVDALRTIGIPARVTGTPAWHGGPGGASGPPQGNHNWVEVFVGKDFGGKESADGWAFLEALPAGGGESFSNPCDKWFCSSKKGYGNGTRVFAAVFGPSGAEGQHYPMEWEPENKGVPGVERTALYAEMCNKC